MGAISVSGIMITAVAWLSSSLASLFFIAGGTAGAAKVRETLASEGWGRKAGLLFLGCALLSIYAAWLFGTG